MPPLRRLSALLFGLLFLQLTLVGDGGTCRAYAMRRGAPVVGGIQMGHMSHDGMPSSHKACGSERDAGCASMASCAVALSLPALAVTSAAPVPTAAALPEPVSIRSGPSAGPDVPPPRG